ncbi:tripartite tricarboxylate transporter substrate-binding protein [Lacibacterium aquatile]|uniref:Tripartite tricarboxylate transporter substrate-binding protein n=1 Tax=Lacibacterium aquatile TaxID=1168082 RepID=A0ABW5DQB3_9PROT
MRSVKTVFMAALATTLLAGTALAQDYPTKPVTVVVPFAAGGPTDTVARLVAQSMSKTLGQQVLIENVGGAGGTLGAARVAKSPNDGYTLLLHHIGHATAVALYRKLPYNALTDFQTIGLITDVPMTIVAKADLPPKTMAELIDYVKANKDKVSLANAGIGSASHLCGMMLMSALQTQATTVAYTGTGPAMNNLLGGQVDLMCDQTTNTTGQIKGGKIKAYSVTTLTKVPSLPDLPTADSAGLKGFEVAVWHGLYAPKGTAEPIVNKLNAALKVALKDPTVVQRFADLGTEPVPEAKIDPKAHEAFVKAEVDKWSPVIKAAGEYAD